LVSVAADLVRGLESSFALLEDGPQVSAEWLRIAQATNTSGKQLHDANIVATMLVHGVSSILTANVRDFQRFAPWIEVLDLAAYSAGHHAS
jgi:predicted nucleic acid-binding protein